MGFLKIAIRKWCHENRSRKMGKQEEGRVRMVPLWKNINNWAVYQIAALWDSSQLQKLATQRNTSEMEQAFRSSTSYSSVGEVRNLAVADCPQVVTELKNRTTTKNMGKYLGRKRRRKRKKVMTVEFVVNVFLLLLASKQVKDIESFFSIWLNIEWEHRSAARD